MELKNAIPQPQVFVLERLRDLLASGQLLTVLPAFEARPMPLSLVYASRRNQSTRVRVVMDWLASVVSAHCAQDPG